MNSLGMDIHGCVVVVKSNRRNILPSTQQVDPDTSPSLLAIPASNPGEGAYRNTRGHLLFGYWLETGKRVVIDSRDVERVATLSDLEGVEINLPCIYCEGTGHIGQFACSVCHGSGHFTPIVPVEA